MTTGSLTRARDFRRVRAEGRRGRSDGVGVIVAPSPVGGPRLGLAVGRAGGSAVTRNRVRRRLRAAWGVLAPTTAVDVVMSGSPSVASMPFQKLVTHVNTALTRAQMPS